jgi:hypothetical protein
MGVKYEFFDMGSFIIGNGKKIRFEEDIWLGDQSLSAQYPSLFNIIRHKDVTVPDVLSHSPLNISFRRALTIDMWHLLLNLVEKLMEIQLVDELDRFSRMLSVKSMYADFMSVHTRFLRKYLWKLKGPLKINICMWFL